MAEVEGNAAFPSLAAEYAAECAIHGLPAPIEKLATYRVIENTGLFHAYGAFLGDEVIGFIAVLTPVIPHYGVAITVAESFFVAQRHRKSGAGIKLLRRAEQHARDIKSPGLLISAPSGGQLAKVVPRLGYRETNRVFFREFHHA